jgi:hypothetical protein
MKPRPILEVDRDAQIVALWHGRPREQRRAGDVDAFCQWVVDFAPWLLSGDAHSREHIGALLQPHIVEDDDTSRRAGRRRNAPRTRIPSGRRN